MSKKIIFTTVAVLTACTGAAVYGQDQYDQAINSGIENIKTKLLEKGITIDYSEKHSMFFKDDIVFKNFVLTSKMLPKPITIEEFTVDRNSFKQDENKLYPFIKFNIKGGVVNFPVVNIEDTVDVDYLYSYNKDNGDFTIDIDTKFNKLLDFSFFADFANAQDAWNFPIDNKNKKGGVNEVNTPEEFKKAIGDLTLNKISLSLENKDILDLMAKTFIQFTQGRSDVNTTMIRSGFAQDIRTKSNKDDNLTNLIADFIEKGGEIKINASPEKPLLIKEIVDDVEKLVKEDKSDEEIFAFLEKKINVDFKHDMKIELKSIPKNEEMKPQ